MKYLIPIFILHVSVSCTTLHGHSFLLKGMIANSSDSERIYLSYPVLKDGVWCERIDTAVIIGGKFRFEGEVPETTPAFFSFDDMDGEYIYLEPANMKLRMDRRQPYACTLSGTRVANEDAEFRKALAAIRKARYESHRHAQTLNAQWVQADERDKDSLWSVFYDAVQACKGDILREDSLRLHFASEHPDYAITPHLLYLASRTQQFDGISLRQLYDRLPAKSRNSVMGQLAGIQIGFLSGDTGWHVGDLAPDFSRRDASGHEIRLSDYRNRKYVLLDFWAGWCGPCLKELPKVKELYAEYGKRGLQLIGISSDNDTAKWRHAVDAHELTVYPQLLSAEPHTNDCKPFFPELENIADRYDVGAIPFFVLIDKRGRIAARWQHIGREQFMYLDRTLE